MAKVNVLDILYSEERSPLDFHFDSLLGPNVSYFFSEQELYELYNIAKSNKLAGNPKEKKRLINNIVHPKGFRRIFSGTNRVIYRYLEDTSFCLKIAFDSVGLSDSLREYQNQYHLKPFCVKVFDVHQSGIAATIEYVQPIRTMIEFAQVAGDVFDLIVKRIIGKYVLDDIGCIEFFQNYGVRKGFGPVLLDFPYMYRLDGNKLYCSAQNRVTKEHCNGLIDYDATFDNIVCTKCGKRYFAKNLENQIDDNLIFVKGVNDMSTVYVYRGKDLISVIGGNETDFIDRSSNNIIPSTIEQQLYDDFVPNGRRNRMIEESKSDIKIPNFQQKIDTSKSDNVAAQIKRDMIEREKSTFIPEKREIHKEDINIPHDLGEIISSNTLDEDDNILEKFNLTGSDFDEPILEEEVIENNNTSVIADYGYKSNERFEKIINKKQKNEVENNDHLY